MQYPNRPHEAGVDGLRQIDLQQTLLPILVDNGGVKCMLLRRNIRELEDDLAEINGSYWSMHRQLDAMRISDEDRTIGSAKFMRELKAAIKEDDGICFKSFRKAMEFAHELCPYDMDTPEFIVVEDMDWALASIQNLSFLFEMTTQHGLDMVAAVIAHESRSHYGDVFNNDDYDFDEILEMVKLEESLDAE